MYIGFLLLEIQLSERGGGGGGGARIPLSGLTPTHFSTYPKSEPGFLMPYVMVFVVFNCLR